MISLSQRVQGNYGNFPMRASQLWYAGSDGKWLAVAATVEKHWQRLCGAIERNDLIEDERCVDRPTRQRNLEWIVVRFPCLPCSGLSCPAAADRRCPDHAGGAGAGVRQGHPRRVARPLDRS